MAPISLYFRIIPYCLQTQLLCEAVGLLPEPRPKIKIYALAVEEKRALLYGLPGSFATVRYDLINIPLVPGVNLDSS